jgi:hypothetical protein
LVPRPLIVLSYQPWMIDDDKCGSASEMRIGRRNRSTRRKPAPASLCPPQIPYEMTWARTRANRLRYGTACSQPVRRRMNYSIAVVVQFQARRALGRSNTGTMYFTPAEGQGICQQYSVLSQINSDLPSVGRNCNLQDTSVKVILICSQKQNREYITTLSEF